jgi:high-affinity iron transporter
MFEVVLFYQALWVQAGDGGGSAIVGGIVAAALALAAIGLAIFRYSLRLPLGAFFAGTSGLLALLAVIFTGHGIAALQEAGVIGSTRLGFDPVPLLGIYPTGEAIAGQLVSLILVVFGYCASRAKAKPAIQKS